MDSLGFVLVGTCLLRLVTAAAWWRISRECAPHVSVRLAINPSNLPPTLMQIFGSFTSSKRPMRRRRQNCSVILVQSEQHQQRLQGRLAETRFTTIVRLFFVETYVKDRLSPRVFVGYRLSVSFHGEDPPSTTEADSSFRCWPWFVFFVVVSSWLENHYHCYHDSYTPCLSKVPL